MSQTRAIFHDEEVAREVAGRLARDGFDVEVRREPFAGEDDDEDHPWALLSDAPAVMLELIAEEYDGWVDFADDPAAQPAAFELPTQPRKRHRES